MQKIISLFILFIFLNGNLLSQITVKSIHFSNDLIYAGTNQGVFQKEINSQNWKAISTGLPDHCEISILISHKNDLYGVDQGKTLYRLSSKDTAWVKMILPTENTKINSLFTNDTSLFLIDSDEGAFYSTDQATSWIRLNTFEKQNNLISDRANTSGKKNKNKEAIKINEPKIKITDLIIDEHCFLTGISVSPPLNGLYKSCDQGKTWQESSFDLQKINVKKIIQTENKIYIITSGLNSEIYFSEDHGLHWIKFTKPPLRWVTLLCADKKLVFAANHRDGVCVSYDFGYTWEKLGNLKLKSDQTIEFIQLKNRILYIGTSDGIITMNESNYVWSILSEELNNRKSENYFYAEIGRKNDVSLAAGKFADKIIFKAENFSSEKRKIEIHLIFECSTYDGKGILSPQKMDWLIEIEPNSTISYQTNPKTCSVSSCSVKTIRWEITDWSVK